MHTSTENILDVTLLEPKQKHPQIFIQYDKLLAGESFIIHNDHDPKPLYYQLIAERGNHFHWEYLMKGPEYWDVAITKHLSDISEPTLGQIATSDLRKAKVFKKFGLDFCCGGKKTLSQACSEKGIDILEVTYQLENQDEENDKIELDYDNWNLTFLVDFIVNRYQQYLLRELPELEIMASKVVRVHGSRHPEVIEIAKLQQEMKDELLTHMVKEERILFPYIVALNNSSSDDSSLHASHFGTIQNPINMMEMEHEFVGEHLAQIKSLTNSYTPPLDACSTFKMWFLSLKEMDADLQIHIHLENNILFPKAIELEKTRMN